MKLHIKTEIRKLGSRAPAVTLEVNAAKAHQLLEYLQSMIAAVHVMVPMRVAVPVPRVRRKKGGRR